MHPIFTAWISTHRFSLEAQQVAVLWRRAPERGLRVTAGGQHRPPSGRGWSDEVKFDGCRLQFQSWAIPPLSWPTASIFRATANCS